jgi:hypothetical protein
MNYILEFQKKYPDKYLLLDSDMFLVDHFDTDKYQSYDCAIVLQSRNQNKLNYFWNGIYYFDMLKMKNKELLNTWNENRCSQNIWLFGDSSCKNMARTSGRFYSTIQSWCALKLTRTKSSMASEKQTLKARRKKVAHNAFSFMKIFLAQHHVDDYYVPRGW